VVSPVNKPEWLVQMEGILETLNEGVLIVDDCHEIIFVNQYLYDLTGFAPAQALGRRADSFYDGDDAAFIRQQIQRGEQLGENRYEFYIPRRDGRRVPVIISTRTVEDPDGRPFVVITFTDITAQKQAQEQLSAVNLQLEARQREIERELQLAARVQRSLAPKGLRWGPFAVETFYLPVSTIGGDFGLVTPLGESALNLLVCDVTGHGISSALIANRIYTETLHLLEGQTPPGDLLRRLNEFVYQRIQVSGFYFSLAIARLYDHQRRLTFAAAGHPPVFWVSSGGEVRRLEPRSMVLGLLDNAVGPEPSEEIQLSPGDRLVLYTDGLYEVFDKRGELLGVDGLEEIVRRGAGKPLVEMKEFIVDRVAQFRHGPHTDDISLVLTEVH
jgi:sigma-B regulation protein RsbU (phosphoserine phosphatase)